jgi:glycyl-tRNA synthetase
MTMNKSLKDITNFCKRKGFVFQAAQIYGGLSGFFDFGPLGCELKNNIKELYWKKFIQKRADMVGQDGSIITNPTVWKASGHVDCFADLVLTTKDTKTKLRADHFIEDELKISTDGMKAVEIQELIDKHNLKYNGEGFEPIEDFNLMFKTQIGAKTDSSSIAYLRPETCQSIFPNFKLIYEGQRLKLPFGIAQIGKAFRNEISPRDFIFRVREFEQGEIEYFFNPNEKQEINDEVKDYKFNFLSAENQEAGKTQEEITFKELLKNKPNVYPFHANWLYDFLTWFIDELGLSKENLRVREHVKTELSHYSTATFDIDYKFPFGRKELLGMAYRGNYDLTQHQKFSKANLTYFDEKTNEKLLPHVIEPSVGIDRLFFAVITEALCDDEKRGNFVLKLSNKIAPYKVAIFPLMKKDELIESAQDINKKLLNDDIISFFDVSGSIGKRYARQDEIGTPFCITVDYETLEEGENKETVTIRDRDSTKQKRVKIDKVVEITEKLIKGKISFDEI